MTPRDIGAKVLTYRRFAVTVKHHGQKRFIVAAEDAEGAVRQVVNAEGCPASAIISVFLEKA